MKYRLLNKDDLSIVIFFATMFFLITFEGFFKYLVLYGATVLFLIQRKKISLGNFCVIYHSIFYSGLGLFLSFISGTLSFVGIKQMMIYLGCGICSIVIFSHFASKKSRIINLQFYGLIIAYLLRYGQLIIANNFEVETCLFAYIFGIYGLIYYSQNKYLKMFLAILFIVIESKRITYGAFLVALLGIFLLKYVKGWREKRILNEFICILLVVIPFIWVYLGSTNYLTSLFAKLHINTMGRVEGTSAWNIVRQYYDFSVMYTGKGIGWVLCWLEQMNFINYKNMHNDFLAAFIELGFCGYIIWLLLLVLLVRIGNKRSIDHGNLIGVLLGFTFINMMTDNIYIYISFLLPFYIVILSIIYGNDSQNNKRTMKRINSVKS